MDAEEFKTMLLAQEAISNKETLIAMRCSEYPHLDENNRGQLHKEIHKKAYPNIKPRVLRFDDIGSILNG